MLIPMTTLVIPADTAANQLRDNKAVPLVSRNRIPGLWAS
jgi:hypothetical protein